MKNRHVWVALLLLIIALLAFSAAGASSPLDAPVAHFPDSIEAGEPLTVSIDPIDEYSNVKICWNENGEDCYCYRSSGEWEICPFGLDPGEYTFSLQTNNHFGGHSEWVYYSLTVTGERPAVPQLIIPEGEWSDRDTVWVTLLGSGLKGAQTTCRYDEDSGFFVADEQGVQVPISVWYSESTKIYAKINNRWAGPLIANILPAQGSASLDVFAPSSTRIGEDLSFTTQLWKSADYYTFSLSFIDDEDYTEEVFEMYEEVFKPDADGHGVIPGQYFTKAGRWSVGISAYRDSDGFYRYGAFIINVLPVDNRPAPPSVTMITQHPLLYADAEFSIDTRGASRLSVLIKAQYGSRCSQKVIDVNGDTYTYTYNAKEFTAHEVTAFYLLASVCKDGVWSDYSEPLFFQFEYDGQLEMNMYHNTVSIQPQTVLRGDPITVSWEPVDGAEWYSLYFYGQSEWITTTEEQIIVDTSLLPAEHTYCWVYPYAVGKRQGNCGFADCRILNASWKPVLSLNLNSVFPETSVPLTIAAAGGDLLDLYVNSNLYGTVKRDDSGSQQVNLFFSEPGLYTITAEAYDTEYVRSVISEPVTIVVRDPNAPQAAFILPASLVRIEDGAFAGVRDITVQLSDIVEYVAPTAFDPSVTIIAPEGSPAAVQCLEYGLTVINP